MADQLPRRIEYPDASVASGPLYAYLTRLVTAINQIPTFSYTSYSGGPNSQVTGVVGDMLINLAVSANTTRLYVKEIGSSNTGWVGK